MARAQRSNSNCFLNGAEVKDGERTSAPRSPGYLGKAACLLQAPHFVQMSNVGTSLFQDMYQLSLTELFLLTALKHCHD